MHKRRGFTLIELMIVVAIIAILAAIAIPNLLRSRMNANEAAAIAGCRTCAGAQEVYHRTDYDGDGILEYSTDISGPFSLFETTAGAGDLQLVDQAFANAEGAPGTATPKSGYVFLIRGRQGAGAPGGARPLFTIRNGQVNLVLGHALSAVPAVYDSTGRNSFQVSHAGTVYQLDRGTGAVNEAHVPEYDPTFGGQWVVVE